VHSLPLQHELDSPTATIAVVEAWDTSGRGGPAASSSPDAGRDEPPSPSSPPSSLPSPVGLAIWWTVADEVQLLELAVRPAARRRGAGAALAALVAALPPPGGCALLEVAADNAAARATYRAAGWREVGLRRAYYRDGSDAVLMRVSGGKASGDGGRSAGRGELPV